MTLDFCNALFSKPFSIYKDDPSYRTTDRMFMGSESD